MAATKEDIRCWIECGLKQKATHMVVVCDTYEWDDYPIYIKEGQDVFKETQQYRDGVNMTKLMEIYDLRMDIESQMKEVRAFHY